MSQPIRVEEWAYPRGARVSLRLRYRSHSSYTRLKAEFHNPSGGVIKVEGVSYPGEESGASHTEVVLTGNIPESAAPRHLRMHIRGGAYRRQEVGAHFRRPRLQHPRGRTTLPRPKRGRVPRTRASVEGGKPKAAAPRRAVATKEGNHECTHDPTRRSSEWC